MSKLRVLPIDFLDRPAPVVAPELLGVIIERSLPDGKILAQITEVEAYTQDDPASHAFGGQKIRNQSMFLSAGHIYVYRSYGIHWCFNIVCGPAGRGEGVLVRGLKIIDGLDLAWQKRYGEIMPPQLPSLRLKNLTNGPGKAGQALAITKAEDGLYVFSKDTNLKLFLGQKPAKIKNTSRIGISKAVDHPWRWVNRDLK